MAQLYSDEFFAGIKGGAARSAAQMVPILMDIFRPTSVVDVGCGTGDFLAAFKTHGVADIQGIDGEWADPDAIRPEEFAKADLSGPLEVRRRFDLALSLEVAEHLPETSAGTLVDSLVRLSPCVVFSAAIPHQGGTHHVNEQWPDYWSRFFARHNYVVVDCLRDRLWQNPSVQWWYAQNTLVYIAADRTTSFPKVSGYVIDSPEVPRRLVHPQAYLERTSESVEGLGFLSALRLLPGLAVRAASRRLRRS